jgi:hypothetical protein
MEKGGMAHDVRLYTFSTEELDKLADLIQQNIDTRSEHSKFEVMAKKSQRITPAQGAVKFRKASDALASYGRDVINDARIDVDEVMWELVGIILGDEACGFLSGINERNLAGRLLP